jgi:hypothetical protein
MLSPEKGREQSIKKEIDEVDHAMDNQEQKKEKERPASSCN